ncbi:DNA repair protein RecO [candidate division KSB1 bacterium]
MSLRETEGYILSTMPHGDTSKIIRVFTREYGRISLIAKGVKKAKSKSGGALDTLNLLKIVYYYKESRELQLLSKFEIIDIYPSVKGDLNKLALGIAVLETVINLIVEEEQNEDLFQLIKKVLDSLDKADRNFFNIYWYFLFRFLKLSGYEIVFDSCRSCGKQTGNSARLFSYQVGGIICEDCTDVQGTIGISAETLQVMRSVQSKKTENLLNLSVSDLTVKEINGILSKYYTYHFDGYRPPESLKLIM